MSVKRTKKADRSRSDGDRYEAALADHENPPLTKAELERLSQNVPSTRYVRRKLKMSREEFAHAFGLPVSTVRDWEEGRRIPDQGSQSLLRIIAQDPEAVRGLAEKARLAAT